MFLMPVARLKDGATIQQAQAQADAVAADLRNRFIIRRTAGMYMRLEPMRTLTSWWPLRFYVPHFAGSDGRGRSFLLLIACSNVANLLLVRAVARDAESCRPRGSWRKPLAARTSDALRSTPAFRNRYAHGERAREAWHPRAASHCAGQFAAPRFHCCRSRGPCIRRDRRSHRSRDLRNQCRLSKHRRPDVAEALRSSGRTAGLGAGRWLRNSVVVAEVALSFVLLIGSGLMFRSFLALQKIDPGFDPGNLLTFLILGNRGGREPAARAAFIRDLQNGLKAIPGVEGATAASFLPLDGGFTPIRWGRESALNDPGKFRATDWDTVLPGYFETMHVPLLAGRTFNDADNAANRAVVVIDQMLAAKAFPNESAVGKRILTRINTPDPVWVEVIGVVAHQRESSLAEEGREQIFFTDGYLNHGSVSRWAVRTKGDPSAFVGAVRAAVARKDPHLAMFEIQPMQTFVEKARKPEQSSRCCLIGLFAVIAALLTGVGPYGVLSTVVRQRTAEIGAFVMAVVWQSRSHDLSNSDRGLRLFASVRRVSDWESRPRS